VLLTKATFKKNWELSPPLVGNGVTAVEAVGGCSGQVFITATPEYPAKEVAFHRTSASGVCGRRPQPFSTLQTGGKLMRRQFSVGGIKLTETWG
jgi:hypothetical protein